MDILKQIYGKRQSNRLILWNKKKNEAIMFLTNLNFKESKNYLWFLDSRYSNHMTSDKGFFSLLPIHVFTFS